MAPHAITPESSPSEIGDFAAPDGASGKLPSTQSEPIAIIGMGCRLPGDSSSPGKLWNLLSRGDHGRRPIPEERFNVDGYYHPDSDRNGSMSTREVYAINEDIRAFQNSFFGINNLEATYMDPQQRKLLEVTYECFESAGLPLSKISGANIGCYVGNFTTDFITMQSKDPEYLHRYSATGMGTTILANRISHAFNMKGPSFVLDTACSSSLYCLHVACSAIDAGECDSAVVAGANLIQSPEQHLGTLKAGVLSKTSTCHTFDTSADGYGRADGVGALLVKRLSQAIKDGDPIRSIVRGTAVNSNGKTNGITLPDADGQEAVIRKAYARSGCDPIQTQYVECHGTGTAVGDPIEVDALSRVMGRESRPNPTLIGSVKTNLGHSEAASAISSIMKVSMAMEHNVIPETIGVNHVNPKIKTQEWNTDIVTKPTPWPKCDIKRAGINSFGYGGANAHAIIEAAPSWVSDVQKPNQPNISARNHYLLPLSAYNKDSLNGWLEDLSTSDIGHMNLVDLAYTLSERRSRFSQRGYLVADQRNLPQDLLKDRLVMSGAPGDTSLPFAFVFTGQGAQWAGMSRELISEFPSFKATIQELDAVLQNVPHPPKWTLESALLEPVDTSQINKASHSQPICTAVQIALVDLFRSWEISPSSVIGHSSGEIAAAYAAGHLSAAEAIISAYYRGYVVAKSQLKGTMMAAGMSPEKANESISDLGLDSQIRVACINSPQSVTISGDADGIDELLTKLQDEGAFARKLKTDGRAYHSHHMSAIGDEYETLLSEALRGLPIRHPLKHAPTAKFISSVTNNETGPSQTRSASYWRSNLENPVRFSDTVKALVEGQKHFMIELGPHGALELPIKQTLTELDNLTLPYASALSRGKSSVLTTLGVVGKLWNTGYDVSLDQVNAVPEPIGSANYTSPKLLLDLPNYHWTYDQELWHESRMSTEFRNRKYKRHDLLGSAVLGGSKLTMTWRNFLTSKDLPWLPGHKLSKTIVIPGAAYAAMAIEALCQFTDGHTKDAPTIVLRNANISNALALDDDAASGVEVFTELHPHSISRASTSTKWHEFCISSYTSEGPVVHAQGEVGFDDLAVFDRQVTVEAATLQQSAKRTWYERFAKTGLNFSGPFQSMKTISVPRRRNEMAASAEVSLVPESDSGYTESDYIVHPATIDALLQAALVATSSGVVNDLFAMVPVRIGHMSLRRPPQENQNEWHIDARAEKTGFNSVNITSELCDTSNDAYLQLSDVRAVTFDGSDNKEDADDRHPMLRVVWKPEIGQSLESDITRHLPSDANITTVVELLAHKDATLSIIDLFSEDVSLSLNIAETLKLGTPYAKCAKFAVRVLKEGSLQTEEYSSVDALENDEGIANSDEAFDVVLANSATNLEDPLLATCGHVIGTFNDRAIQSLRDLGFDVAEMRFPHLGEDKLVFACRRNRDNEKPLPKSGLVIATRGEQLTDLEIQLQQALSETFGTEATLLPLSSVSAATLPPSSTVLCTFEIEEPVLAHSTQSEMHAIKAITDNASNVLWVTRGDLMNGTQPNMALINGLSRSLMLEQPSLTFGTFDIERREVESKPTVANVMYALKQILSQPKPDFEFIERDGLLYVSRFVPEPELNSTFSRRQQAHPVATKVAEVGASQLATESTGKLDSLHFKPAVGAHALSPDDIEIAVTASGINAKDFNALSGRADTKDATCNFDSVGTVVNVGSSVEDLQVGDRVVSMAPSQFATVKQVPQWACVKLNEDEDAVDVAALPLAFATALYALQNRANLRRGEKVLIHSAAGGLGLAAIQIAQMLGAEVFATVGTDAKKKYLVDECGLNETHVYSSRDSSFLTGVLSATNGLGVDVVLNSLVGDLLHDSWNVCAPFGRFIEIGKKDIVDAGLLEMTRFKQSVTFSAFDLRQLYESSNPDHHRTWNELLRETMRLYRSGHIRNVQVASFDVSEVSAAFKHFSAATRMGKIVVSFQDAEAPVQFLPPKHSTNFSSTKSYLMVGCLGGLGRSISKWMMARGARKFVFLGRSGTDKTPARQLVEDLRDQGGDVVVVRGDVVQYADVEKVVASANGPIGGVVQAAMGLNESLFTTMPNEYWHTGIDPKVIGTWNLHNAIKGKDSSLDFFMMTSSISGSVGTATESNYCSGNFFLDMFARHRSSQGLPACSIGLGMISEVGYLHENPEIEAILLRKGIQSINEEELLQIVDLALSGDAQQACVGDSNAAAHLLTGLEPLALKALRNKGFEGESPVLHDPRATVLLSALGGSDNNAGAATNGLPNEVAEAMESGASMDDAVRDVIARKFSNFILLPVEKLNSTQSFGEFGMDSMLAAEFRSWLFQLFRVDVSFLTLLAKGTTIQSLSKNVAEELQVALGSK